MSEQDNPSDIEQTYQKKTPIEHILLRPDTYIGSTELQDSKLWVWDSSTDTLVYRQIAYAPGLFKIFDEILVNAADNYQRDRRMTKIEVDVDKATGMISVFNNGKGIPVTIHPQHKIYVPELIFGHLLTSSNFNDSQKKVTGGRNGYGAKLANVFSRKFTVETADSERMKKFHMEWSHNLSAHTAPQVLKLQKKEDFTRVTFYPDFAKFGMAELDENILALITKRVYDLAGCTGKRVNVKLNGKAITVSTFEDYMKLYVKDTKTTFEVVNDRWEVGVTVSDGTFQQVSFVNGICTSKGGTHVNHVLEQLTTALSGAITKRHKKLDVKNAQIKQHLWVFVKCLIENPCFDSQTKETMTLKPSAFGSKCELSEKFLKEIVKSGVIDQIVAFAKVKTEIQLGKKVKSKKNEKLFVHKLEDANCAGTHKARKCTLILTEGDSAKALAMAGLEVVGRDLFGVFPLKGKLLNVREASHKQLIENKEIQNIMKIMGLQPKKEYAGASGLRYGSIMIMADQDLDGSHIKGLVVNLIAFFWPSLVKTKDFLQQFITPLLKASKGSQVLSFFSLPEYEEWVRQSDKKSWKIKYYKGLGTSTSKEGKEYFANIQKHRIFFKWTEDQLEQDAIDLAFNKKRADDRKEWLANHNPELYVDYTVNQLPYHEFINKEFIQFSNYDNHRSIPSLVDGLKQGQRKILFACFKRKLTKEAKVAQLASYVAEISCYHHGENSLANTIIGLSQNFTGSNNLNLLLPIGQFGTRAMGGKDVASARYIYTALSELTRKIFIAEDDFLLSYKTEEGVRIEPVCYFPIIPMVLVNGADGIGTGWSTSIPPYNPLDLIHAYKHRIQTGTFPETNVIPWFRGYCGTVEPDRTGFELRGGLERIDKEWLRVTELPVRRWTQDYKQFLEELSTGEEPLVLEFREEHTEYQVNFEIRVAQLEKYTDNELFKKFKLSGSLALSNLVLISSEKKIKKYKDIEEIMEEHFIVRETVYNRRKDFLTDMLSREAEVLSNKVRFITEVIEGTLLVTNIPKSEVIAKLKEKGFMLHTEMEEQARDIDQDCAETTASLRDYDYLLSLPFWSLTREKYQDLISEMNRKLEQLELLRERTVQQMWLDDLQHLYENIVRVWETEDAERGTRPKNRQKSVARTSVLKKNIKKHRQDSLTKADDEFTPDKPSSVRKTPERRTPTSKKARTLRTEGATPKPKPAESAPETTVLEKTPAHAAPEILSVAEILLKNQITLDSFMTTIQPIVSMKDRLSESASPKKRPRKTPTSSAEDSKKKTKRNGGCSPDFSPNDE